MYTHKLWRDAEPGLGLLPGLWLPSCPSLGSKGCPQKPLHRQSQARPVEGSLSPGDQECSYIPGQMAWKWELLPPPGHPSPHKPQSNAHTHRSTGSPEGSGTPDHTPSSPSGRRADPAGPQRVQPHSNQQVSAPSTAQAKPSGRGSGEAVRTAKHGQARRQTVGLEGNGQAIQPAHCPASPGPSPPSRARGAL